jgi:hypothetical protein
MKNTLFLLLLFSISFLAKAQTLDQLQSEAVKLYDATYNMDIDYMVSKTYPKLFNLISKEDMEHEIDNAFQNEVMRTRLVFPKTTFIYSDVKTIAGKKFCVITYKNTLRMTYEEKLTPEMANMTLTVLRENLKNKKVSFESPRNSFYIEGNDTLIAIADTLTNHQWTFINYDEATSSILSSLFEETVIKQLELGL